MKTFLHYLRYQHQWFLRESVSYAGEYPSLKPHYVRAWSRFMFFSIRDYVRGYR